ncbi:hypothetical protein, partial [Sporosarcina cyprini]|uniref:hypothetical protein n=1 Tax=Sporosarcina cyprini TaxID=2910523 RepID=UPI001EDCC2F9
DALISAKNAEIRQIELFVVRLAHRPPPGKRPPEAEINFTRNLMQVTVVYYFYTPQQINMLLSTL